MAAFFFFLHAVLKMSNNGLANAPEVLRNAMEQNFGLRLLCAVNLPDLISCGGLISFSLITITNFTLNFLSTFGYLRKNKIKPTAKVNVPNVQ
jgi:hypothetical protein